MAWSEMAGQAPLTLSETISRASERDFAIQAQRWNLNAGEARIQEISFRDGWEAFLEGEQDFIQGNRLEKRDASLGRSVRRVHDNLKEDEWMIQGGLQKRFWGASHDREADIAVERLDQLDRLTDLAKARQDKAFEAAEAYLSVYEGSLLSALIAEQIAYASEVARIFETRSAQGEEIELAVREARLDLSQLTQRLRRLEFSSKRKLAFLQDLLERPNLEASELAAPEVPGRSEIESATLESLIAHAYERRAGFQSAEVALDYSERFAAEHAGVYPDVDLKLTLGYHDHGRDFSDESRSDEFGEVELGGGITIPLGIVSRNQVRKQRFQNEAQARAFKLADQRRKTKDAVMDAHGDYLLAVQECRIQEQRLENTCERLRVLELTAEQLPDLAGANADLQIYRARSSLLEVRSDVQRAEHARLSALLLLSAESGYLLDESELIEEIRSAQP